MTKLLARLQNQFLLGKKQIAPMVKIDQQDLLKFLLWHSAIALSCEYLKKAWPKHSKNRPSRLKKVSEIFSTKVFDLSRQIEFVL